MRQQTRPRRTRGHDPGSTRPTPHRPGGFPEGDEVGPGLPHKSVRSLERRTGKVELSAKQTRSPDERKRPREVLFVARLLGQSGRGLERGESRVVTAAVAKGHSATRDRPRLRTRIAVQQVGRPLQPPERCRVASSEQLYPTQLTCSAGSEAVIARLLGNPQSHMQDTSAG
jgi:hypothetical protein